MLLCGQGTHCNAGPRKCKLENRHAATLATSSVSSRPKITDQEPCPPRVWDVWSAMADLCGNHVSVCLARTITASSESRTTTGWITSHHTAHEDPPYGISKSPTIANQSATTQWRKADPKTAKRGDEIKGPRLHTMQQYTWCLNDDTMALGSSVFGLHLVQSILNRWTDEGSHFIFMRIWWRNMVDAPQGCKTLHVLHSFRFFSTSMCKMFARGLSKPTMDCGVVWDSPAAPLWDRPPTGRNVKTRFGPLVWLTATIQHCTLKARGFAYLAKLNYWKSRKKVKQPGAVIEDGSVEQECSDDHLILPS